MGQKISKYVEHRKFVKSIAIDNGYGNYQIEKKYQKFQEDYPKGYMTQKEFIDYYISENRDSNKKENRKSRKKIAKKLFQIMDVNKDEKLDFREYISLLALRAHGTIDQKLAWTYNLYDADNNGSVTIHEVVSLISVVQSLSTSKRKEFLSDNQIKQLFDVMDLDGDETLSLDEFTKGCKENPTLMRIITDYVQ